MNYQCLCGGAVIIFDQNDQSLAWLSKSENCRLVSLLSAVKHYSPVFLIYTPWKHQKPLGFLVFSGAIYKQYRAVMGEITLMLLM